ncbi:BTB/POZ domain-containing protein At5g17580-like [Neltuma alba]|uniref:BTB/POZ domain-containing protein At5g17580-like n=1 Tax=Neltuma alba TaxID=207710 RepID=UPI0010A4DC12|nr:BTB/POZ domain-containing protein At5g17580-like [Prosopis alba]
MSNKEKNNISSRFSNPTSLSNLEVQEVLAAKSTKVAALLEKKSSKDEIFTFLRSIPAKPETFELVVKFCYGFELQITTVNVVPLACLACYLEMSESRCKNNLIGRVIAFFQQTVLPSWKETIKALRCITEHLHQAKEIGLFDVCLDSIVEKVQKNPCLLGEPMKRSDGGVGDGGDDNKNNNAWPNARRKLFVIDCDQEDLTTLPVQIYEPIVHVMNLQGIAPEYVAASVCKYTEKWVFSCLVASGGDQKMSAYKRNSIREIIEAIERLLPNEKGLIPCSLLFDLLRSSILLGSSLDCVTGFETRIGKQLEQASLNDLFIPSQCINVDCLKRILKSFYRNFNGSSDPMGFLKVAELVEEYLGEVASSDTDLGIDEFISLAELAVAASLGSQKPSDGIYRAIDIYLEKHKSLTEAEKEQVCQVLDCQKMSQEALQHAAQNSRLPLRMVVQILFVGQLHLRDQIASEVQEKIEHQKAKEDHQEDEEMQMMNMKVSELERESLLMKKEIEKCHRNNSTTVKKESVSVWTKMKRKFGCISSSATHEGYSRVNKKKLPP